MSQQDRQLCMQATFFPAMYRMTDEIFATSKFRAFLKHREKLVTRKIRMREIEMSIHVK